MDNRRLRWYLYRFIADNEWRYAVHQSEAAGASLGYMWCWAMRKYGRVFNFGMIDDQTVPLDTTVQIVEG